MSNTETKKAWAVLTNDSKIVYIKNKLMWGRRGAEMPVYGQYSFFETQEVAQIVCDYLNENYPNPYSVHEVELTATVEVTNPSKVSVL